MDLYHFLRSVEAVGFLEWQDILGHFYDLVVTLPSQGESLEF